MNACEFRHGYHETRRLENNWTVFDWQQYTELASGYCPGRDDVSMTIDLYDRWETEDFGRCMSVIRPEDRMVDFGSHIGWYAIHAAVLGAEVVCFDADPENSRVLSVNAETFDVSDRIITVTTMVQDLEELEPQPIRLVKADVEGAEFDVVRVVRPSLEAGLVDYLMLECSPEFDDRYPQLIDEVRGYGFRAFVNGSQIRGDQLGPVQKNVWFAK